MITIKDFIEACQYKITGGTEYQWRLFGHNAYFLDSETQDCNMSIVFDRITQEVYVAEVHTGEKAYRLINPKYLAAYKKECDQRGIDFNEATDSYDYTDLETDEDWIEKATAIANGEDFDDRIQVPITLPDDEMFQLMKMAHENDITLNQMVERILRNMIEREQLCQE